MAADEDAAAALNAPTGFDPSQIPEGADLDPAAKAEKMRELFAQLLAQGSRATGGRPYTDENLWQAQGQAQLPPPPPPDLVTGGLTMDGGPGRGMIMNMPKAVSPDPGFEYPTAAAGLRAPEPNARPPGGKGGAGSDFALPPFPGAESVQIGPYELPRKKKAGR